MKKLTLIIFVLITSFSFSQRTYTEGSFIFEKGEDLSWLVPKKTKIQIFVHSDSLIVNDIAPDTLLQYLRNLYGSEIWTKKWKAHQEELFPHFFAKAFGDRMSELKIESGLDVKDANLIMNVYARNTQVKNMKPPGMSTSSHTEFRILVSNAGSPKDVVAHIEMSGIPGGMQAMNADNTWVANIKFGCRRAAEMLGDYFIQNKK